MNRNRLIAVAASLSLALMSAPALAYPSADTLVVSGYDVEAGTVLYGVSAIDQEGTDDLSLDCRLVGEHTYTAGTEDTDDTDDFETYDVTTVEDDDGPVGFSYESVNTESDDYDATLEVPYGTKAAEGVVDSEECDLTLVTITPNGDGDVNHGTIVSTFARLLGQGQGCLVKMFAQSEYGKAGYVDDEAGAELAVLLESAETSCAKGKPEWAGQKSGPNGTDDATSNDKGKPEWAGQKGGPKG